MTFQSHNVNEWCDACTDLVATVVLCSVLCAGFKVHIAEVHTSSWCSESNRIHHQIDQLTPKKFQLLYLLRFRFQLILNQTSAYEASELQKIEIATTTYFSEIPQSSTFLDLQSIHFYLNLFTT